MELEELGRAPLSHPAADWNSSRELDPDYLALNQEIARMSSVSESAAAPPDWELIVLKAANLLSGKIKDIQVAGYAAVGLLHQSGLSGLATGLEILADLFALHSDTAYPPKKRQRARLNAVQWWLEHAVAWLGDQVVPPVEADLHAKLLLQLNRLQQALDENFRDDAPLLNDLKQHLLRIPVLPPLAEPVEKVEAEEIAVETLSSQPGPPAGAVEKRVNATVPLPPPTEAASPVPPAAPAGITRDDNPAAAKRQVLSLLNQAAGSAEILAAAEPTHPLPYRLRRLAAWSGVETPPPAEEGRTLLAPPEGHVGSSLEAMLAAGDFAGAVRGSEERVGAYLFWLDLQRISAEALAGLGAPYQAAWAAVKGETLAYLARFPSLVRLAFSDGTPFASARTKVWLESLAEEKTVGGGGGEMNPAVLEALERAKGAGAKPEEALKILGEGWRGAGHPRERLALRLAFMRVLAAAGRAELARAQVPEIVGILDRHGLDVWEGGLAASALAAVLGVLGEDGEAGLTRGLRDRLAVLDPAWSLRLG